MLKRNSVAETNIAAWSVIVTGPDCSCQVIEPNLKIAAGIWIGAGIGIGVGRIDNFPHVLILIENCYFWTWSKEWSELKAAFTHSY